MVRSLVGIILSNNNQRMETETMEVEQIEEDIVYTKKRLDKFMEINGLEWIHKCGLLLYINELEELHYKKGVGTYERQRQNISIK